MGPLYEGGAKHGKEDRQSSAGPQAQTIRSAGKEMLQVQGSGCKGAGGTARWMCAKQSKFVHEGNCTLQSSSWEAAAGRGWTCHPDRRAASHGSKSP